MGTSVALTFFLVGIAFSGFALASLLFFKFFRASGDPFFRWLGVAFAVLALERVIGLAVFIADPSDQAQMQNRTWLYLFRLVAFIIILAAVIAKNRPVKN